MTTDTPTTRANVIARHRLPDDTTVNAAVIREGELVLNVGEFAFHLSPDLARDIQREITIARVMHDLKHEGVAVIPPMPPKPVDIRNHATEYVYETGDCSCSCGWQTVKLDASDADKAFERHLTDEGVIV